MVQAKERWGQKENSNFIINIYFIFQFQAGDEFGNFNYGYANVESAKQVPML